MSADPQHHMTCMEVWGGNTTADRGVVMAGLDAWVYSKPFDNAPGGGDVYYVSSCATGRITRLLVADVSGHGAAVCDVAGQLRALMRRHVNRIDASAFVRSMNQQFAEMSKASCFATAVVATFFGPAARLQLCNAGHPPPLLFRAKSRTWCPLDHHACAIAQQAGDRDTEDAIGDVPLGILDDASYRPIESRLDVGDLVICYTDSLIESRDASGEFLGVEGLLRLARTIDVSDPAQVVPALLRAIAGEREGNLVDDDVTVLLFRPNGLAPAAPFGQRLLAPVRLMKAALSSLLRGGSEIPWPEFNLENLGGALFLPLSRWRSRRLH